LHPRELRCRSSKYLGYSFVAAPCSRGALALSLTTCFRWSPYGVLTGDTVGTLRGTVPLVPAKRFVLGATATRTIGTETFVQITGGWGAGAADGLDASSQESLSVVIARPTPTTLKIAEVSHPGFAKAVFDPPLGFDLDTPVGEKVTYEGGGSFQMKPDDPMKPATGKLDLTVVEKGATVGTESGVVAGTQHLTGTIQISGDGVPDIVRDVPVEGDLWVHPDLGIVKVAVPSLGIGVGWEGVHDCAKANIGDLASCRASAVVDTNLPLFRVSTNDRSGVADADKMQHAKMLLELRYANEDDAIHRTDTPNVQIAIGNTYGVYSGGVSPYPFSIVHPEEKAKGYRDWSNSIDSADKYAPGPNGIEYYTQVKHVAGTPPVRVTARLIYHLAP